MPEAEATSRGQLVIMRMKGRHTILGGCCTQCMLYFGVCCTRCILYSVYTVLGVYCTRCMLYSVYTVLGVNSGSWHGEIESDDLTSYFQVMVELRTRKGEMGNEDENDVVDTRGYEKSGVQLA